MRESVISVELRSRWSSSQVPVAESAAAAPAARMDGLSSFDAPDLEVVERRRLQLWAMALLLLLATAAALSMVAGSSEVSLPGWISQRMVQASLVALVALFAAYAVEKELALRDLTRRLLAEQVLTAALSGRLEEAHAMLEAGRALHREVELESLLDTVLDAAVELLDGQGGSIMLVHDGELRTVTTTGLSGARGARVAVGDGLAGRVAATLEPLLISGSFAWRHYRPGSGETPTSAVSAPLVHRGELLGVLNVNASPGRPFTEHDLRPLSVFAEQAGGALAAAHLIETQRAIASHSAYHAQHDGLTGLPNRSALLQRLETTIETHRTGGSGGCALLLVDLDDFRRVNDSLGHAAGDRLLTEAANRLREAVRTADTVARVGADEFAVLLAKADAEEASTAAARLQLALAPAFSIEGRELEFTASIGIALGGDATGCADDLLRSGTTALYAAKARGKGRIEAFQPAMRADAVERLDLEQALRRALEREQLELHFQPIAELGTRRGFGLEALLRWRHPSGQLIDAGSFLPFAERAGLVPAIDRWVVSTSCRQLANRLASGSRPFHLSINLSPVTLQEPGFPGTLAALLGSVPIDPGRLVFEVTETALLTDTEPVAARLRELRALGARVALDDFGTGYSSLSWLRAFPVDRVKVDRVFVEALGREPGAAAVIEAIVRLGRGLAFEVVAEGIGSEEQIARLLALGCNFGQGYHLGHPLPLEDALAVLDGTVPMAASAESA